MHFLVFIWTFFHEKGFLLNSSRSKVCKKWSFTEDFLRNAKPFQFDRIAHFWLQLLGNIALFLKSVFQFVHQNILIKLSSDH